MNVMKDLLKKNVESEIAIIGISCLFPGSKNYEIFWQNLIQGKNFIQETGPDRWSNEEYYSPIPTNENKMISKWGGFLDDIKGFDNDFFNILPDEARSMDPQSRLLLQETWHCIEDACIDIKELQHSTTAVYTAIFSLDHLQHMAKKTTTELYACLGSYPCMTANRISHFFKLTGPSFSLDAACASSLIALHEAKLGLRSGCCDYAIVGAANIISHPWHNISMSKARLFSPDGQCKAFDKTANGYVRGEGVSTVLLTTKQHALNQGYRIHAILKGSACNHSGGSRAITTPSFEAQKKVISLALQDANKTADDIDFLETHGTGTTLGDAIEFNALAEVFSSKKNNKLSIGSLKTNIGHTEACAGLAGVIKAILMMKYNLIPPHLHLKDPNPLIDLVHSPLNIYQELTEWPTQNRPRAIGISSMGFGGVNSHVILEEWKSTKRNLQKDYTLPIVFLLSANSLKSLQMMTDRWACYFSSQNFSPNFLSDICCNLLRRPALKKYRTGTLLKLPTNPSTISTLPMQSVPKNAPEVGMLVGTINSEILHTLSPLFPLVFTQEELDLVPILSNSFCPLLVTYALSAFFLKMGIMPKLIGGYGVGQIVVGLIAKCLDWQTAMNWLKHPTSIIQGSHPEIPIIDCHSNEVLYPQVIDREKCESLRQVILRIKTIDKDLLIKVSQLVRTQISIRQTLESIERCLKGYKIIDVLNSRIPLAQPFEAIIVNLSMLLSLLMLNGKYKTEFPIHSEYPILLQIATLISKEILSFDRFIASLASENDFFELLQSTARSDKLGTQLPIFKHLENISMPYQPHKNHQIISQHFQNMLLIHIGDPVNSIEDALQLLIDCWLQGNEIRWENYACLIGNMADFDTTIPTYEFDVKPF